MPHSHSHEPSNPPQTTVPDLHLVSSRASSHIHHPLRGLDALNFPATTTSGPQRTDEYVTETQEGYLSAEEEEPEEGTNASPSPTVVGGGEKQKPSPEGLTLSQSRREKALQVKIVTWKENDPDDPRNWGFKIKW